jgi:ribonuclease R
VVHWLKCEYLLEHVGDRFRGVVVGVTSFGLFVELEELYVEGLVHITNLPKDYYHHEPAHHRLVGERTRRAFRLGDRLEVQVARVDLDERKVDFQLIDAVATARRGRRGEGDAEPERPAPPSGGKRARKSAPIKDRTGDRGRDTGRGGSQGDGAERKGRSGRGRRR